MKVVETYSDTLDTYYQDNVVNNMAMRKDNNPGTSYDGIIFGRPVHTGTVSLLERPAKMGKAVVSCEIRNRESADSKTDRNKNKDISVITSLWKHIDKLKLYGVEWVDEDIEIGPTDDVLETVRNLIPKLVYNDLIPFRIAPSIDEGVCLAFQKDSILVYIEFYNDGDIGMIAEDFIDKRILENIDLKEADIIPALIKIFN